MSLTPATENVPPVIECQGLTRDFGSLRAVDHLDLNVRPGELFGFLGPNASGKTTTIKMMTGLLRPTEGTAKIGGFDIQKNPLAAKRILGYIPDTPFLYDKLTGREFLGFMADLYSVPLDGREHRVDDLLRLFDLLDQGNDLIAGYSRGMRQKIALAGALIHQPKVIFLDEPTVNLDPRSARLMKDVFRTLCDEGAAVFLSTHILEIAERMCDRFAIINKGKVVAIGTMEELRASAASDKKSLEDIFLDLTGGEEYRDLVQYLN